MRKDYILDTSEIPKELSLLIELLKDRDPLNTFYREPDLFSTIDWKEFLDLALHHRVYPILYNRMKILNKDIVPEYVLKNLERLYKINTFEMLKLCGEMEQINQLFIDANLRFLYLKGPILAKELYQDISLRTSKDLDLLIPLEQLEVVERLLTLAGYKQKEIDFSYIPDPTFLNEWKWRGGHHISFFHPEKRINIEVHWKMHPPPSIEPSFEDLWRRKRTSHLLKSPAFYLGQEDLLFYLCAHGARHGWFRLRWLFDIHQIMKKEVMWEEDSLERPKYHYYLAFGQGLLLSSCLFGTEINGKWEHLTNSKRTHQSAQNAMMFIIQKLNLHGDLPETFNKIYQEYQVSLLTLKQRIIYEMTKLYPSRIDNQTLELPKSLHFLYFPLRPILAIWRKFRNHAVS